MIIMMGGVTYERWWIFEQTFRTPCGLQCKGLQCHSNMSYMGIEWTFENDMATIRCPYEKKECKLLHASDMEKRDSENKRERRRQARESAVRRLEKKLLENGYESLEKFSVDRRHADKWLGEERIAELEQMRLEKEKERREQPVQLSLFDMEVL